MTGRWMGRWIMVVGLIHLVFGFIFYADAWRQIADAGIVASVDDFSIRATAYWFVAAAPLMLLLGGLIDHFEKHRLALPAWFAWSFAVTLVALLTLMPVNGAWLFWVPVIGLFLRRRSQTEIATT